MQQMPHPHSRGAMNNYDNHGTMASFINAQGAQTWGRLGFLIIIISVTKICSCWGARQACLQNDVTGESATVFAEVFAVFFFLTLV